MWRGAFLSDFQCRVGRKRDSRDVLALANAIEFPILRVINPASAFHGTADCLSERRLLRQAQLAFRERHPAAGVIDIWNPMDRQFEHRLGSVTYRFAGVSLLASGQRFRIATQPRKGGWSFAFKNW
jgi:hypothetical protein